MNNMKRCSGCGEEMSGSGMFCSPTCGPEMGKIRKGLIDFDTKFLTGFQPAIEDGMDLCSSETSKANVQIVALLDQFSQIRVAAEKEASTPLHQKDVEHFAAAEIAVKNRDGVKFVNEINASGEWILEFARNKGASLVVDLVEYVKKV